MRAPVKIVILDLETTGLCPKENEIIEFGCIIVHQDGNAETIVRKYFMRKPETAELKALQINQYDADLWEEEAIDMSAEAALELRRILSASSVIVAHNPQFDISFLRALFDEFDIKFFPPPAIDTRALARMLWGFRRTSLDFIREQLGWGELGHTALVDCQTCFRIWCLWIKEISTVRQTAKDIGFYQPIPLMPV